MVADFGIGNIQETLTAEKYVTVDLSTVDIACQEALASDIAAMRKGVAVDTDGKPITVSKVTLAYLDDCETRAGIVRIALDLEQNDPVNPEKLVKAARDSGDTDRLLTTLTALNPLIEARSNLVKMRASEEMAMGRL